MLPFQGLSIEKSPELYLSQSIQKPAGMPGHLHRRNLLCRLDDGQLVYMVDVDTEDTLPLGGIRCSGNHP